MVENALFLLKLSGVVNVVKETKTEEVAAGIPKGLKVSHRVIICLSDETKMTLTRDTEPFDGILTGDPVEVTITSPQTKLA